MTTGSKGHDAQIVSKMTTQKTVADKKKKAKSGYRKHKIKWDV